MRRAALPALALLLALMAPAQAQDVGRGERVDVVAAEFPALAVAERPFYINVTVRNKEPVEHTVLLFATLYSGSSDTPCEGSRALQPLSKFQKSVSLGPRATERVEGEPAHWAQVVNGSRVPGDGSYEVCVWARLAQCPAEQPVAACFMDFHNLQLAVRLRNEAPQVAARAEPVSGTTATSFRFTAEGSDPEGDPVHYRWDFGDGSEGQGPRATHRFRLPGSYKVTLNATDGFDFAEARVVVQVAASGSSGANPVPGWPFASILAALALTAARRARPR